MNRKGGTTAARALALSLCSTASVLSAGCVSTGAHTIRAENPQTTTHIDRFELLQDEVVVHGMLRDSRDRRCEKLTVRPHQSFNARGTNCTEKWTLKELRKDGATFDVRGRYYSCTDLFGIIFGTPSRTSHWTVTVRPPDASADASPSPNWFR